ncbi:MAG: protein phosphatase 2C domain-containing protein [Marinobacter sp.]|uniref:PP2C family protein-serine/threonine phosphatase n=1 Tax=Marinobacter sp. TaxID=50741 RepID=UPI00299F2909|nr:protein phosphatase 2C domain-containing protein [Marinobacter sp.]MDX1757418.1 protein phosphatase 2C domain-containing protein [Marinobacter sp.]
MSLVVTGLTDIGTRRSSNQDSLGWFVSPDGEQALAVIADGMGGYQGGEIASRLAVDSLMDALRPVLANTPAVSVPDRIHTAITLASERLEDARQGRPELARMGTTVVLAWVQGDRVWLGHLGDSRGYLVRAGRLSQLTRDHTVAQNMVDDGSITPDEAHRVPFRNVLTRALGACAEPRATVHELALEAGDRLLLCSDGLTGALPDTEWLPLLQQQPVLDDQVRGLMDASLHNRADDNVSVVMIQYC